MVEGEEGTVCSLLAPAPSFPEQRRGFFPGSK